MRYAVFSDVHANLEAFQAVIKAALIQKAEAFISLGDIVGYGSNPNECVTLTRNFTHISLAGNHDRAVLQKIDISCFNSYAQAAILWTQKNLSQTSYDYLKTLPLTTRLENILLVHATPYQPNDWNYLFNSEDLKVNFQNFNEQICLIGHSHVPGVFIEKDADYSVGYPQKIKIKQNQRYIVNVGSVGQPRDGDPRSCYIIYDSKENILQFHRVAYDIKTAQKKIMQAGLPQFLAERLEIGQ